MANGRVKWRKASGLMTQAGWLHVDAETLQGQTSKIGWSQRVVNQQDEGNYLQTRVM